MSNSFDRLLSKSKGQQGASFEAQTNVERRGQDFPIFASYNDNLAMSTKASATEVQGEITVPEAMVNSITALRNQPNIIKAMSLDMVGSLSSLASVYEATNKHKIDVESLYNTNDDYKHFLNAIASGFVVTAGIEKVISNPIKLYFLTSFDGNVDMSIKAGYLFMGVYPTITSFDSNSVNKVQSLVRTVNNLVSTQGSGLNLMNFIIKKGLEANKSTIKNTDLVSDKVLVRNMDTKQLAELIIGKFSNVNDGIKFAKENGVNDEKLQKVSMLIKALKDFSH